MSNQDRRPSSTSHMAEHAAILNRAAGPSTVPPSIKLRPQDKIYWDILTMDDARVHWREHHLHLAGQCARAMADLDREQDLLDIEGYVSRARGRPISNPRAANVDRLMALELRLLRQLGIVGWRVGRRVRVPIVPTDSRGLIAGA